MSTKSRSEVSTGEKSTTEISTEEYIEVFKNWKELKGQDLMELFKAGWKPSVRTRKKDGYRYIRLRRAKKGSDGKWRTKEKTLGAYDPERWEALLELFPERDKVFPINQFPLENIWYYHLKWPNLNKWGGHTANIQPDLPDGSSRRSKPL